MDYVIQITQKAFFTKCSKRVVSYFEEKYYLLEQGHSLSHKL